MQTDITKSPQAQMISFAKVANCCVNQLASRVSQHPALMFASRKATPSQIAIRFSKRKRNLQITVWKYCVNQKRSRRQRTARSLQTCGKVVKSTTDSHDLASTPKFLYTRGSKYMKPKKRKRGRREMSRLHVSRQSLRNALLSHKKQDKCRPPGTRMCMVSRRLQADYDKLITSMRR